MTRKSSLNQKKNESLPDSLFSLFSPLERLYVYPYVFCCAVCCMSEPTRELPLAPVYDGIGRNEDREKSPGGGALQTLPIVSGHFLNLRTVVEGTNQQFYRFPLHSFKTGLS